MEIRRLSSGVRATALLVVSITITAAIVAAILIDTVTAPALSASARLDCATTVHPVHTLEFIGDC